MKAVQIKVESLKILTEDKKRSCEFTAKSLQTGKDFTFKVKKRKWQGKWLMFCDVERQYQEYHNIGFYTISNSKSYIIKAGKENKDQTALTIKWIIDRVLTDNFETLERNVVLYHTGKCIACNRKLTDAKSIETGFGPMCRKSLK